MTHLYLLDQDQAHTSNHFDNHVLPQAYYRQIQVFLQRFVSIPHLAFSKCNHIGTYPHWPHKLIFHPLKERYQKDNDLRDKKKPIFFQ